MWSQRDPGLIPALQVSTQCDTSLTPLSRSHSSTPGVNPVWYKSYPLIPVSFQYSRSQRSVISDPILIPVSLQYSMRQHNVI